MRANSDPVLRWLHTAFADLVVDDEHAPANYSVQINSAVDGRRPFHFLFQAGSTAVRSASPRRIVHALLLHLADLVTEARTDVLTAGALPLVKDGRAVLVPSGARADLKRNVRQLSRAGISVDDHHHAAIDVRTGELVVATPDLTLAPGALVALEQIAPEPDQRDDVVPAGRYPVVGWAFLDPSRPELTPADGVLRALGLLRHAHAIGVQGCVDSLGRLFSQRATPVTVRSWSAADLVGAVDQCLAADSGVHQRN